ncbi:hypothetical protein [Nostoc sp. TCL26-01]|uniref:hypothetical protein n=1 Tax=Nostoc sp. TCL26-01 TaxID=2576904 RepID=UPI0015B9D37E|nr:hypothetical protein [Nostoc sp. TCL26-01]QLE54377.1 hypothetical protein FD725_01795 [Nostoc sp. TCL26-01]
MLYIKIYKILSVLNFSDGKKNTLIYQMRTQSKSLTELLGKYLVCQMYTRQKPLYGENINILGKLYRSILSKCRYTSLELAVQAAAVGNIPSWVFMAHTIAKYCYNNPVKVGNSDKNKVPKIVAASNYS